MAGPLVKGYGTLGPYGPLLGMGHRYAYLAAAIVMGSITLSSTIITFILARTHNDLKQRGRYLVFWNGLSATGIIVVYLMLNAYVGDFPCFVLLWTSYLCIVPWLLTYLARAWRLVYIYNQQVDFGKRTLQRSSAIEMTDLHVSNRDENSGSMIEEGSGIGAGTGSDTETRRGMTRLIDGSGLGFMQSGLDHDINSGQQLQQQQQQLQLQQQHPQEGGHAVAGLFLSPDNQSNELEMKAERAVTGSAASGARRLLHERDGATESPPLPSLPVSKSSLPALPLGDGSHKHNVVTSTISRSPSATPPRIPTPTAQTPISAKYDDAKLSTRAISSPVGIGILPESNGVVLDNGAPWHTESMDDLFGRRQSVAFDHVVGESTHSWSRFLPFNQATDGRLAVFLMGCMVFPFVLCLGMQFVKPSPVQIDPVSYKCGEGPVLRWVKDGFGIRNELLMAVCIGTPGFILYFISPFYLSKLDAGHWNHVNWLTLTIFFCHVNSVVLPLIQFLMRQIPKQRPGSVRAGISSSRFTSIFRWDSGKAYPGTPPLDVGSDTSSFRFHSRASSQVVSPPQLPHEQSDSSVYDRQSIGQHSTGSTSDMPAYYSTTTGHRVRGMKGFWAKYGKDAEGNIVPLSEMNPRAFEYALHDPEMLAELVKFSVTVFSAENTKFLQEYEGLRKQVREYYRLVGSSSGHGQTAKQSRQHSALVDSTITNHIEVFATESDSVEPQVPASTKPAKKKSSLLSSVASSLKSKLSAQGGEDERGSRESSNSRDSVHGSVVGSIVDMGDGAVTQDGGPGSSMGMGFQPSSPYPTKSFGRHRSSLKGNLWRFSIQSSLRHPNPASTAPYGSVQEEDDDKAMDHHIAERRSHSAPSPLSTQQPSAERYQNHHHHHHHCQRASLGSRNYHSEVAINTMNDVIVLKRGSGGNESEQSSISWYGDGNTGSALSYQDVTPSDISSYQDTASERLRLQSGYFGGANCDHDPVVDPRRGECQGLTTTQEIDPSLPALHVPSQSQSHSQSQSQSQAHSRPELGPRGLSQMTMLMPTFNRRTPVPRALQSAYWEISNTFIMPNSILELNLTEAHIHEIRSLFANSECYLEMYEPIVKEVQELVYSNVWPRFVQSIQRHPSGLPGKFKRTWKAFFGKGPEDQGDEIYHGGTGIRGEGKDVPRRWDNDELPRSSQQRLDTCDTEDDYTQRPLPMPPPPQASYIHGRPSYLGRPLAHPGVIRLRGGESEDRIDCCCENDLDMTQFGVMQELDLSAFQRIVVDPK
ncbi:hypothetical protein BGX28_001447 [Mortierella sp. GBA30]|nr:hypothetical protein BGX28_001447 [Mortierella sp. GBA30]